MKSLLLRAAIAFLFLASLGVAPSVRASEEGNDLRAADAELNQVYKDTLEAMPNSATKARLREAQRAWVAFRDAEITLNSELPGASGNTLKMLQTDLTEARTKQLKALAEAVHNGNTE